MADHGEVRIRNGSIQDLLKLYRQTYKKLLSEIINASEAGKIQKARVLARINAELESLGVDVNEWVKTEVAQYYLDGANVAIQDLRALGVDVSKTSNFAVINREAIKSLTDETALNFAQGITAVSRNANRFITDALKQQLNFIIAEGKLTGETRRAISANLKAKLESDGIQSITDRAGRQWSFDRYTEMLARTKAVEARNQGLTNRMLTAGYDLVQVSNHGTDHEACAVWEGKILSLTGKTAGYPTLEAAKLAGLFHPNCKHAINVINLELAQRTIAYDNPYNYRKAAATESEIKPATKTGKPIVSEVFHGSGGSTVASGNNLFGDAYYVARDKKTAQVFGFDVKTFKLSIRPSELLRIQDQADYNRFVSSAIGAFPNLKPQQAYPAYAKSLGYKAIEASPNFDDLGGIAILDKSVIR